MIQLYSIIAHFKIRFGKQIMTTTHQTLSNPHFIKTVQKPKILIGMTGGIACYKIAVLVRLLVKNGADVQVVMTKSACEFITPLTMQALSGNQVHTQLLDETAELGMGHIELAKWADLMVIAPLSANTMAKLAAGLADNLLTTICLATTVPIILAPAMNQAMWANPITQDNVQKLSKFGFDVISPDSGEQACGDVGAGRLPEPEFLFEYIHHKLAKKATMQTLTDKTVVITAGATLEPIDPIRFLSNYSSGKMGFAVAKACQNAGAKVILVCGKKVNLPTPIGVKRIDIGSADDMLQCCQNLFDTQKVDVFIAAAAVADYKMATIAPHKLKKSQDVQGLTLDLVKNPDILAYIAKTYPKTLAVGFAAETQDTQNYAKAKLIAKNLDMIACNDVSDKQIGFGSDDNAMSVFFAQKYAKEPRHLAKAPKFDIAKQLVECISELLAINE